MQMTRWSWRRLETSVTNSGQVALDQFDFYREAFPRYLRGQRGLSENTEKVYMADLQSFREYLVNENLALVDMDRQTLRGYLAWLSTNGKRQRQAYVARQYQRQFENGADALRKIESNLNEIKSMQEREIQMMERQKLLEDKYKGKTLNSLTNFYFRGNDLRRTLLETD